MMKISGKWSTEKKKKWQPQGLILLELYLDSRAVISHKDIAYGQYFLLLLNRLEGFLCLWFVFLFFFELPAFFRDDQYVGHYSIELENTIIC